MKKDRHKFATYYLRLTAAITALLGIILITRPDIILQWFIPSTDGDFFIRFIGSALLGYSTLNFLASSSNDMTTYRIALDANLVALSIATILSLIGVVIGVVENLGWLLVGEHLAFAVLFLWVRMTLNRQS